MKKAMILVVALLTVGLPLSASVQQKTVKIPNEGVFTVSEYVDRENAKIGESTFISRDSRISTLWEDSDDVAVCEEVAVDTGPGNSFVQWQLNSERASLYDDSGVLLWDHWVGDPVEPMPLDVLEDGSVLAMAADAVIKIFDPSSSTPTWEHTVNAPIDGIELSPDGLNVYVSFPHAGQGHVEKYEIGNATAIWTSSFNGDSDNLVLSGDGSTLVFTDYGSEFLRVLNSTDGSEIFQAPEINQWPPAISDDASLIVNGDYNGVVIVYAYNGTTETYDELWTYDAGSNCWIIAMSISGDGNTIAIGTYDYDGGEDGRLFVFDSGSSVPLWSRDGFGDMVCDIDMDSTGAILGVATYGPLDHSTADFFLFEKDSSVPIYEINTPGSMYDVDMASDGSFCTVGGKAVHANVMGNGGLVYSVDCFLAEDGAPAAVSGLVATPDAGGALNAVLGWVNPSLTYAGDPLTELLETRVYRDDVLIHTNSSPVIGAPDGFTDAPSVAGMYEYEVTAYNSIGEGPGESVEIWVGEDVPGAVEDLLLENVNNTQAHITWTNPTTGLHGGAFNNPILGYAIERDDGEVFDAPGIATEFTDTVPAPNYYRYSVTPYNASGNGGTASTGLVWIGEGFDGIIIWDLDPTPTGAALRTAIQSSYSGTVVLTNDIHEYPLAGNVEAVFVLLGIYTNNFQLTETEAALLASYLDDGGNVYMEGGDTWFYDPQTAVHPYFNIDSSSDGGSDLSNVDGHDFLAGLSWTYSGENNYIDQLAPVAPAVALFSNTAVGYDCGVAHDPGTYKTVGTSFEITGLVGTRMEDAIQGILTFFEVSIFTDGFESGDVSAWSASAP